MICMLKVKCKYFKIVTPVVMGISLLLLVLVLATGQSTNGASRWFSLMGIQFQPSEIAKGAVRNRKGAIAQPGNSIPEVHAERVIFQEDSKGVEDKGLFEHLRKIRKNLADEQGYPPYIVLSDKSLHELARMKPTTKNAMSLISGIGEFKLNKYGDTFIKAIRKYTGLYLSSG